MPFKTRKDTHRIKAYDKTIQRLSDHNLNVYLQILGNEASAEYKRVIKKKGNIKYQLFPPNTNRGNTAEQAIHTFKSHFIYILSRVSPYLPKNLWDLLLPQIEGILNLLGQATLNPSISSWAYFHSPFNYYATPLGPLG